MKKKIQKRREPIIDRWLALKCAEQVMVNAASLHSICLVRLKQTISGYFMQPHI